MTPEPGVIEPGRWAHVKWNGRQHLVVADDPESDRAQPVRLACGKRTERFRVWHGAPEPHLPRCGGCQSYVLRRQDVVA